jgi:hypothetical protein
MAEESLRYVIVHGEARFSRTEYICGRNSRSEYRNGPFLVGGNPKRPETMRLEFGPRRALIQNRDLGYQFDIDLESRVYTAFELHEYRRPESFTPKVESLEPSGRTVHVRTETIDTGERKEMFGYTARRVTIRTTYRYSPDDDADSLDSEADGWYVDPPAAWLALHPRIRGHAIFQTAVGGRTDTPVFTDVGPRESGFPLLVTSTHRSNFKDAAGNIRIHTSEDRDEVIEFSEAPLPADLFVPPREFRRVRRLPDEASMSLALRVRLGWRNFKYKFRHWR